MTKGEVDKLIKSAKKYLNKELAVLFKGSNNEETYIFTKINTSVYTTIKNKEKNTSKEIYELSGELSDGTRKMIEPLSTILTHFLDNTPIHSNRKCIVKKNLKT